MKKWLDKYQSKGEVNFTATPTRVVSDNTRTQKFIPVSQQEMFNNLVGQPKQYVFVNTDPNVDAPGRKAISKQYENKHKKIKALKSALKVADVATDLMQVGNFIPLPQAQVVGRFGNVIGGGIDAFQSGMNVAEGNYGSAALNFGSSLLPHYIQNQGYRRDMFNTTPGSYADKIASFGNRGGDYIHLTPYVRHANNPVIMRGVNFNRGLLGSLGAETIIDLDQYKSGGSANSLNRKVTCSNCGWSWKLSDGGKDPMTCHKCGGDIKMQNGGELDKYQTKGEVKQSFRDQLLERNRPIVDAIRTQQFVPISEQEMFQNRLRFIPQPVQPQIKQGQKETPYSKQYYKERKAEELKRQIQRNSPLAQTMASFTPSNNIDAGVLGAEAFVNLNPLTGAITSTNRLANAISNPTNNVYWNQNNSVGQNALGVIGALGDVSMLSPLRNTYTINPFANKNIPLRSVVVPGKNGYIVDLSDSRILRNSPNWLTGYSKIKNTKNIDLTPAIDIHRNNLFEKIFKNPPLLKDGDPLTMDLEQFHNFRKFQKNANYVAAEFDNDLNRMYRAKINLFTGELPKDAYNTTRKIYKDFRNTVDKKIDDYKGPLDKLLGSGAEGAVYSLKNNPKYAVKIGWAINPSEDIVNKASKIQGDNIAVPLRIDLKNNKDIVTVMPNLKNTSLSQKVNQEQALKILEKNINDIYDNGLSLDLDNPANFRYNKNTGLIDIFDLQDSPIPRYTKRQALDWLKKRFSKKDEYYKQGGEIFTSNYESLGLPGGPNNLKKFTQTAIISSRGQWDHPGQTTIIPSNEITMQGVPYPVMGVSNTGDVQYMQPGEDYTYDGDYVTEYPMMSRGGQHGGLDRWFAEKWVDIKTGKPCGRQEGESRKGYPACRPSKRISSDTPKTSSELSSSERERFKREKTSSQRISYQHQRKEDGGELELAQMGTTTKSKIPKDLSSIGNLYNYFPYDLMENEYLKKQNEFNVQYLKNNSLNSLNNNKINLSVGRFQGAEVPVQLIDELVKSAKKQNIDPWLMVSLMGRESTFGSGTSANEARKRNKTALVSGWNVAEDYIPYLPLRFLADKKVPGVSVNKGVHGWTYNIVDDNELNKYLFQHPELIKQYQEKIAKTPQIGNLNSFDLAAKFLKEKGIQAYNPKSPKYPSLFNEDMRLLKSDIQLKNYMKKLGYNYGGEHFQMKSGGNVPTNPELYSRVKSEAKSKFNSWPSAYGSAWLVKTYKSRGGGWRKAEYGMEVMGDGGEQDVYWRTGKPMVNDPSMDAISKVLLQRNIDKNFMQRAAGLGYQGGIPTRYIDGQDPNSNDTSNLLMSSGDNQVFPTIIQTGPQQLSYQPDQYQEYIETPSWDVADYFATKGYKRAANDMYGMEYAEGGGIPERYKNMGFTKVGAKKQSTRPGKKWMVLAKKGDQYKVVHGGWKGMQDFKQHHSEQRRKNFWSRMGGKNSSKATDPFSPLYWHKRFGTWQQGGQIMKIGGQSTLNPIVKKDNRNWLEYLKD